MQGVTLIGALILWAPLIIFVAFVAVFAAGLIGVGNVLPRLRPNAIAGTEAGHPHDGRTDR